MTRRGSALSPHLVVAGTIGSAATIVLSVLLVGSGTHRAHRTARPPAPHARRFCTSPVCLGSQAPRLFAPDSIWNAPVPANAPLDPNSEAIVGNLLSQERSETVGIATSSYGVPIYTVPASQSDVHVTLDHVRASASLQESIEKVPIPPDAEPAQGTDANLAVFQPSTNTMWEFWKMTKQADGWHALWGGRMEDVSTDPGYYRNVLGPNGNLIEQANWGTTAASFPAVAGVMTIAELKAGHINHALGLAITNTRAGVWAAPAQRTDGDSPEPDAVPEGAHFRLDPNLDLAALHLPHFVLMMAEAAQKYGIIINNRSNGFTFRAEDPLQFERRYGYNPYIGPYHLPGSPGALFSQWPSVMLREFPWKYLQLLKMNLRTRPDTTPVEEPSN